MKTAEGLRKIKRELHEVIVRSVKTRAEVMEELGLSVNYLDAAWQRSNIKVRTLLQVLEALGEEPLDFFSRALGRNVPVAVDPDVAAAMERFYQEFGE